MTGPLQLSTDRLKLRRLRREDAGAIVAYRGLPEVAKYQSWGTFGLDDATKLIAEQETIEPGDSGSWLQLLIVMAETEATIGDCGIHFCSDFRQQVELGVTLDPRFQHQGFAQESLQGVLDYIFDKLQMHRAIATTDVENAPCQRLFKRLGFRQEGHYVESQWFKGSWSSEYLFAILRREWHNSHRL
jgi:RimJ/RimL family protein N-acetyltransferase